MTKPTEAMIEAAKAAYWHEVHHGGGYSDKCYEAAITAALAVPTLNITKEWFEKRSAAEGDMEVGAGFSIVNPSAADIATMERLLLESLPEWAQAEIKAYRALSPLKVEGPSVKALEEQNAQLQRLFDQQWKRSREAGELWRQAHPGNDSVSPDLGELLTWLMSRAKPDAVKALEWREWTGSQRGWQADSAIGQYQVCWLGEYECWQCSRPHKLGRMRGDDFSRHEKRDEAKSAAQSDYETRIRSALESSAPVKGETEGWRPIKVDRQALTDALNEKLVDINTEAYGPSRGDWRFLRTNEIVDAVEAFFSTLVEHDETAERGERLPDELRKLTFVIQHNPNCPSPWLVRLPGKGPIDMLPYGEPLRLVKHQTGDILGFGKTLIDAARAALAASPPSQYPAIQKGE